MRRLILAVMVLASLTGCKKQHPVSVYVDPKFTEAQTDGPGVKIAVTQFASSLNPTDDPDQEAPRMMERFLDPALQARRDYKFIAPNTVQYAIDQNQWGDEYKKFLRSYALSDKPDLAFLGKLSAALQCDAFLIPVVDLWQKDEVDMQENSSAATYVGATLTIVDAKSGAMLFRATDEDYIEGARSETADRSLVTSSSGAVRADLGERLYKAPPFEDVAAKVALALAGSLPVR